MPERCTNPECEQHWPVNGAPVYLTLHTAPAPPPEVSTGYPRRDIQWVKGEAVTSWSTLFVDHLLDDGDDDE